MWQGIFLPESSSNADPLTVSVQPPVRTAPCPYNLPVQSHALTSVCMLYKIPDTSSRTIVWTYGNTACTDRNGQHCSCTRDNVSEVLKKETSSVTVLFVVFQNCELLTKIVEETGVTLREIRDLEDQVIQRNGQSSLLQCH